MCKLFIDNIKMYYLKDLCKKFEYKMIYCVSKWKESIL